MTYTYNNANFNQQTSVAAGFLLIAVTTVGTYYYLCKKIKKSKVPSAWTPTGEVKKLCIYPFKSGKRLEVDQAECTKDGLVEWDKFDKSLRLRDRSFMVYDENKLKIINSGKYPKMVLVEIKAEHLNHVFLNAPEMYTLLVRIPDKIENQGVTLKGIRSQNVYCLDCGDDAAEWISQYILNEDSGLRIAYLNENHSQEINSTSTSMHIISQVSVNNINIRTGHFNITADYYRPSLVVDGTRIKHFEENSWEWIKVGDVILKKVEDCVRCEIITINPETGVLREDKEPLNTVKTISMSKGLDNPPVMGILLDVFQPGNISVGDIVYINCR